MRGRNTHDVDEFASHFGAPFGPGLPRALQQELSIVDVDERNVDPGFDFESVSIFVDVVDVLAIRFTGDVEAATASGLKTCQ